MPADGLVDEPFFVCPLTRGAGPRLFPDDGAPSRLSLAATEPYDSGAVHLSYRSSAPRGDAATDRRV